MTSLATAETPAPIVNGALYRLSPLNAPTLALRSTGTTNGANVQIVTASASAADQQWEAIYVSGNTWRFAPQNATGMRLNTTGTASGSNVAQATAGSATSQQWKATANTDGTYSFTPVSATGLRLNVQGGGTTSGTNVNASSNNGTNSQKWKLTAKPGTYKPSASTTGVRGGITLENVEVDTTVTADNTTFTAKNFKGNVSVQAANVTFRNCRFSGRASYTAGSELVNAGNAAVSNLLIEDCTFLPQAPTPWLNALVGHDFTVRRCDISLTTDGINVYNSNNPNGPVNVYVEASYIHDLAFWSPFPVMSDNKTHNDGSMIQGGSNINFIGNYITGLLSPTVGNPSLAPAGLQANTAFMIKPLVGLITNMHILNNWLGGGSVTVNFANNAARNLYLGTVGEVSYNEFGRNQIYQGDASLPDDSGTITMPSNCVCTTTGNVYEDNGNPIVVRRNW